MSVNGSERRVGKVIDPYLTPNLLNVLEAMLDGDVLVKSTGLKYALKIKGTKVKGKEMERLTKRSYLKAYEDCYFLSWKGIKGAIARVDMPKLGTRRLEEKNFDIIQRIAFKNYLVYLSRNIKSNGQTIYEDLIPDTLEQAKSLTAKHYKKEPAAVGGIIDIPIPSKSKNVYRNQFRRSEMLRSKVKAKHRH